MRKTASAVTAAFTALALVAVPGTPAQAAPATVSVDFTTAIAQLDASKYGLDITGYGSGNYITGANAHTANVRRQNFGTMRMELMFDETGRLVCGGDGCEKALLDGDDWVAAIRALGAEPMLILPLGGTHAGAAQENLADALAIYDHFAATGAPVLKFVVGNETDNDGNPDKLDAPEYVARFNAVYDALHARNAAVEVGGPGLASYGTSDWEYAYMTTFLQGSGTRTDFVDYHDYGAGYTPATPEELVGPVITEMGTDIADLKARIAALVPSRPGGIPIQLGEWNMDYVDAEDRMVTHLATVWGAAALGTILENGASSLIYGDKNGNAGQNTGLGITSTEGEGPGGVNDPMPIYHGLGMFSGEGLFRGFGSTMVDTSSSDSLLRAFASTGSKNIVLVNGATTATTTSLALTGYTAGSAAIWQSTGDTEANYAPHRTGTLPISGGAANITLPARSVTTLVLAEQGLKGEYFTNTALTGTPALTRVDPTVNFDWGMGTPGAPIGVDDFAVRWTGQVDAPAAATYSFITTTDDGVRLWVDGQLLVDAWNDHSKRDDTGTIALTAGRHSIRMEFYEKGYDAIAQLAWSAPNLARQAIPAGRLFPA
ncbi:PA14 domain-containing protein [Phytomonospora sp. NPDC050363]|uniref:PA14 domain-containing protein n=1 Tax=Phytomonospora sp. NPDC050363 TaxID=3155642 RepID=UPI0033FD971E